VRRIILLLVLLGVLVLGWLGWKTFSLRQQSAAVATAPTIVKQPVNFSNRTFDPQNPPSDMPPMSPGELAVCDSNFLSVANVTGNSQQLDDTHALVTVTQVKVTLQLRITIWVPFDASQHVIEHEQGHREISEYFYGNADKLAQQIASKYIGRQIQVSGANINSAIDKALQQMSSEITQEYDKQLNPEPAQSRYEALTDHGRNEVEAKDAIAQVLNDPALVSAPPSNPKN
jgi:hypothetical protein